MGNADDCHLCVKAVSFSFQEIVSEVEVVGNREEKSAAKFNGRLDSKEWRDARAALPQELLVTKVTVS